MLPVSAWPPGPPGDSLSPFGAPRQVTVPSYGYVIPKGAWIVSTGSNQVVMFFPPVVPHNPARTPGTGMLPGQIPPDCPPPPCPPSNVWRPPFQKFNDTPLQPPGRRPPNWFGWRFVPAPFSTLVPPGSTGQLVIADGQNVVITGGGFAQITQAYSV
jgi:hypothetical protein